jgi:hypothetical protein
METITPTGVSYLLIIVLALVLLGLLNGWD